MSMKSKLRTLIAEIVREEVTIAMDSVQADIRNNLAEVIARTVTGVYVGLQRENHSPKSTPVESKPSKMYDTDKAPQLSAIADILGKTTPLTESGLNYIQSDDDVSGNTVFLGMDNKPINPKNENVQGVLNVIKNKNFAQTLSEMNAATKKMRGG